MRMEIQLEWKVKNTRNYRMKSVWQLIMDKIRANAVESLFIYDFENLNQVNKDYYNLVL